MMRAFLFFFLLAACTPEELPYPWFENEWISDRDSTLIANDGFQELEPEHLETVLTKFGQLRWRVDGFTLEAIYPEDPRFDLKSMFTVEAIDDSSFRLLTEVGTIFLISGNENGFCATPDVGDETAECFVPLDL